MVMMLTMVVVVVTIVWCSGIKIVGVRHMEDVVRLALKGEWAQPRTAPVVAAAATEGGTAVHRPPPPG